MARSRGISGVAVALIGTGALLIRAAIRGTSPMDELKQIITGQRPEPLSTQSRGSPITESFGGGSFGGTGSTGTRSGGGESHTTGKEKPHVAAQMDYAANTWGVQVYGWRARGSVPGSDHPRGLAMDAMIPAGREGIPTGNAIAAYYVANAERLHVKYVIWFGRIWTPARGWHAYFGPSPHRDHVHVSFYDIGSSRAA
jgi:hypothetical protein